MSKFFIGGTGPRRLKNDPERYAEVADKLEDTLYEYYNLYEGRVEVISGGAEGFDELLCSTAYELTMAYSLALPNPSYGEYYWKENSVTGLDRYDDFLLMCERAHRVVYVHDSVYFQGKHTNHLRNEFMAAHSDLMIVCRSNSPGTLNCHKFIMANDIPYILI